MPTEVSNIPPSSEITFDAPPGPEEVDKTISAQPWVLRARLTYDAYATRCRAAGRQPDIAEWLEHQSLTEEELQLLDDLIEARRGDFCHGDIGPKFVIREFGNKARVGWFDDRGELVTMSFAEFANAHIEKLVQVGHDDNGKPILRPLAKHWLQHPLTRRYDRAEFLPGIEPENMPEGVLNLWRGWPTGLVPGWADTRLGPDGAVPITDGAFDGPEMPSGYCDMFLEHMLENMCGGCQRRSKTRPLGGAKVGHLALRVGNVGRA